MKPFDLQDKTKDELNNMLSDLKTKLLKLNFDLAENKIKDVSQVSKVKKDIARVMTKIKSLNN